jgi:hypothetical protein
MGMISINKATCNNARSRPWLPLRLGAPWRPSFESVVGFLKGRNHGVTAGEWTIDSKCDATDDPVPSLNETQ